MAYPQPTTPVLSLAPMQDVTDWPFWNLLTRYGGADVYYTEYFRIHSNYKLNKTILRSIDENPTGRPVVAQMIGNDPKYLAMHAIELQKHPVAGIDLNLGCPAPVVYRKCAGGGLLRDLELVDEILARLRDVVACPLSVKTRVGFEDWATFESALEIYDRRNIDTLTIHGRTVKEMYRGEPHYDLIAKAAELMPCPVYANGNIYSANRAMAVYERTGVAGLMIGRGAIRNPWIFEQIRRRFDNEPYSMPRGVDVLEYIHALYDSVTVERIDPDSRVKRLKRHLNYIGSGIDPDGAFLHRARRCRTAGEFFGLLSDFLDHQDPMPLFPVVDGLGEAEEMVVNVGSGVAA